MAHGVAAALGAECRVRHGLACAVMLPAALRFNRSTSEKNLAALGQAVCARASADEFITCIENLGKAIGIPEKLRDLGVRREQIPALVAGSHGNSMAGNPREVSDSELAALLESML